MSSFGTELTAPPSMRQPWSASGSVRFKVQWIRARSERVRRWGSWIELVLVELVGELAYGVRVACHCRFPGVAWREFNDERSACRALVVLPRCDASRIARKERQRQSGQGGEAGLDSGVSSGSIDDWRAADETRL